MVVTGQLSFWDAAAYQQARLGDPVDWFAFWVFDGVPDRDAVQAHFESRMSAISLIRRRIAELPGHLDRPYWVVDESPLADHLRHHDGESLDWSACMDRIGEFFPNQLDGRRTSWQLDVFYDVRNCPHTDGPATVVLGQFSHAMCTGLALESMNAALFVDGESIEVTGLPEARKQPLSRGRAIGRSTLAPFRLVPFVFRLAKTKKPAPKPVKSTDAVKPDIALPTAQTPSPEGGRTVRFVQVPTAQLKGPSVTVTAGVLTAMSQAMQDYAESATGERSSQLTSNVVVALPDAELMGVNRLTHEVLNLRGEIENIGDRARAIAAALRGSRQSESSESSRDEIQARVPFLVYRLASTMGRKRIRKMPFRFDHRLYTALTSLVLRTDGSALAGSPLRLLSVYQGGTMGLTHSLCGTKDTVTIGVVAQKGVVTDIDEYAARLQAAAANIGNVLNAGHAS